jgi:hypothetical protein
MTSESALDGSIVGLHLVLNGRTKERLIVGGADDGSVAFWKLEYVAPFILQHSYSYTNIHIHQTPVHSSYALVG